MENDVYCQLSDKISSGQLSFVENFLSDSSDLDVTYNKGQLFVISVEENYLSITEFLLNYYYKNQLSQEKIGSKDYNLLKYRLKNALEVAAEGVELSPEMQELLSPYIDLATMIVTHKIWIAMIFQMNIVLIVMSLISCYHQRLFLRHMHLV